MWPFLGLYSMTDIKRSKFFIGVLLKIGHVERNREGANFKRLRISQGV
jgi:hypothetical protein